MEKERFEVDELISSYLLETISEEERDELNNWLNASMENQRYFSEQKNLWALFDTHQKMLKIDEKKAFKKVSGKINRSTKIKLFTYFQRVAAVVVFPLLAVSIFYYGKQTEDHVQIAQITNTVETPLGMRSSITLPDSTRVWLNAGSRISFPVVFSNKEREVSLSGEAYFEVRKNKKWPFIVTTKNVNVIVTGTKFNCNAYPENEQVQTVLVEGEITLTNLGMTENRQVKPGELAVYNKSNGRITKVSTDLQKYVAWKNGKLMFRDDKMDNVVEKLERWYNVDILIADKEIADYVYTATFVDESLDQVLKMLSISAPIRYTISDRKKQSDNTFERSVIKLYKKV
jgi:ferric-dicitrate binding protein FerR (iron transport regulator)